MVSREGITLQQFSVLLNTLATVQAGLREWKLEDSGVPEVSRLAGEARLALEASLLKTCARIDKLVDDDSRWSIDRLLDIERKLDETLATQNSFFASQKAAADDTRRPSRFLSPELIKTPQGWVAFFGDVSNDTSLITGIGESPAEAMASFDEAYYHKLTPEELPNPMAATSKRKPKKT